MDEAAYPPQPESVTSDYSPGFMQTQESNLIQWQLDFAAILSEVEHRFKGEFLNDKGQYIVHEGAQLMNKRGVSVMIQLISTYMNKGVPMSSFTTSETGEQLNELIQTVIDTLELRYKEFEIEKENLRLIITIVEGYSKAALNRAKEGITLKFLKSTEKVTETHLRSPEKGKGGLFSFFNR